MIGYVATVNLHNQSAISNSNCNELQYENIHMRFCKLCKFEDDKMLFQTSKYIFLIDGVIYNRDELFKTYGVSSLEDLIVKMHEEDSRFYGKFRGSFSGIICDKKTKEVKAFTNQTGEKSVFYYKGDVDGKILISNNYKLIVEVAKRNNLRLSLNERAFTCIMKCGYFMGGQTAISQINRITAGKEVVISENGFFENRYHLFSNSSSCNLSESETISEIDRLFVQAVKRACNRSNQYQYTLEADLSGGLDSRMINIVAKKLGYGPIVNLCYSQKNSADQKIASSIAKDLSNKFYFQSLDNGDCIFDMEEMIEKVGGQQFFLASTGSNQGFKQIKEDIGVSLMGLYAEILKGDQADCAYMPVIDEAHIKNFNAVNTTLAYELSEAEKKEYEDVEIYNLYNYGFHYILSSAMMRMDVVEVAPIFMDVDLLEFSLSIPAEQRKNCDIYLKWVKKRYPEACQYVWQTTMKNLYGHSTMRDSLFSTIDRCKTHLNILFGKMGSNRRLLCSKDMNPIEYWMKTNKGLSDFVEKRFCDGINIVENVGLREQIVSAYRTDQCYGKLYLVNALEIVKKHLG